MERPDPLLVAPEARRRVTVDEYYRMGEAGVFAEGERVELLAGVLVTMSPQSYLHSTLIERLTSLLVRGAGEPYGVRVQLPLTLGEDSEPEPDLAVVRREDRGDRKHHTMRALLVVEVSVGSVRIDRLVKAPLYAAAAIPEYWLVEARRRCVEVYRDPDAEAGRYRTLQTLSGEQLLAPAGLPGPRLPVAQLFAGLEP